MPHSMQTHARNALVAQHVKRWTFRKRAPARTPSAAFGRLALVVLSCLRLVCMHHIQPASAPDVSCGVEPPQSTRQDKEGVPTHSPPSLRGAPLAASEEPSASSDPDKTPVAIRVCMSASPSNCAASVSPPPLLFRFLVLRSSNVVLTPLKWNRANLILVRSSLLGEACAAERSLISTRVGGKGPVRLTGLP